MAHNTLTGLRKWCFEETQDRQFPVIGWRLTENGKLCLVKVAVANYDKALSILTIHGSSELQQVSEECIASLNTLDPKYRLFDLDTDAKVDLIGPILQEFIPIRRSFLGVGLVDIAGFSALSSFQQMKSLRLFDAYLAESFERCIWWDRDSRQNRSGWARPSTGDGCYLFSMENSHFANISILKGLLLLAAASAYHRNKTFSSLDFPSIKIAYTIGECYTFFRTLPRTRYEYSSANLAYRPTIDSVNAIGDATNELSRILNQANPGQILITARGLAYLCCEFLQPFVDAVFFPKEDEAILKANLSSVPEDQITAIMNGSLAQHSLNRLCIKISNMFKKELDRQLNMRIYFHEDAPSDELFQGNWETLNETAKKIELTPGLVNFALEPSEGTMEIIGKRSDERFYVLNLRGTGFHLDRLVNLGLKCIKPRLFSDMQFWE